jgi:hypothetical protein
MAMVRRQCARARKLARQLLWECGIDDPSKIDPGKIAAHLKIKVIDGPLDGPTAHICRNGDRAVMRVSDAIVQPGRRNFTIAHELGHYVLGHRIASGDELEPTERTPYQEREADVFAAELLMPEDFVAPHVAMPATLATVRTIVDTFRTSIVAAARRYVEMTDASCALVFSKDGHIVWAKHSRSFPGRIPHQMRIGRGTIAFDHQAANTNVLDENERVVSASAWFAAGTVPSGCVSLVENAELVPEPGWGGVVSLLITLAEA